MSDEQSPPDDDGNDDPKPSGDEEPRYTKEQLSRAIARETAKVQRRYERKLESVAPMTETKPEAQPEPQAQPDVAAKLAQLEEDMAFKDALLDLGGVPLDGAKRKALRAFFDPSKPEGLSDAYSALWPGDKPAPIASEPKSEIKAVDIPTVGAQYAPGAAKPQAVEPVADPRQWDAADIQRLRDRGDFLAKIEEWRATLPGNASVFRRKPPK